MEPMIYFVFAISDTIDFTPSKTSLLLVIGPLRTELKAYPRKNIGCMQLSLPVKTVGHTKSGWPSKVLDEDRDTYIPNSL